MGITPFHFKSILQNWKITNTLISQIESAGDSPLKRAFEAALPQPNDANHSHRVLRNCSKLLLNTKFNITHDDYLSLLYSSLLHDFSKSESSDVKDDINKLKSGLIEPDRSSISNKIKKCCGLISDHGIISAHYLEWKYSEGKIEFYGLKGDNIRKLFNIISFHNSGIMHPCFLPQEKMETKELLLCLIFWLADISDGACERALAARLVDETAQSPRSRARLGVEDVQIYENAIIWRFSEESRALKQAVLMSNSELAKHRLLLQAFGLPYKIIPLKKGRKTPKEAKEETYIELELNDIISANLCWDVSKRDAPLVLSADTLPDLYEKIVEAFYQKGVTDTLSCSNYFGPVILEVRNIEYDESDKTNIRSETTDNIETIKKYTEIWLDSNKGAEKSFYFGYTHGQRIFRYLYPRYSEDFDEEFQNWTGTIKQLKHVVKILKKEGFNARRSYVIIPNLIIDSPESNFYHKEEMAPSLLAIHFRIEEGNKLSGFALLRAQELSVFFIVNYFEVKKLIERLLNELNKKSAKIKPGRIVMMSALSYFDLNTVLLDKPKICKMKTSQIESCAREIVNREKLQEFIELLKDFGMKDYIRIETKWCNIFKNSLPTLQKGNYEIKQGAYQLKRTLDSLEKKRSKERISVTHPEIRENKKKAVNKFIEILRKALDE